MVSRIAHHGSDRLTSWLHHQLWQRISSDWLKPSQIFNKKLSLLLNSFTDLWTDFLKQKTVVKLLKCLLNHLYLVNIICDLWSVGWNVVNIPGCRMIREYLWCLVQSLSTSEECMIHHQCNSTIIHLQLNYVQNVF